MKDTKFKKGQSGNPKGRPRKGRSIIDCLDNALDETKGDTTKRQIVCNTLVSMACQKDVGAIKKIFDILQRDFEFSIGLEIEERISILEKKILEDTPNKIRAINI